MQNRGGRTCSHCQGICNDSYSDPRGARALSASKCRQAFVYAHARYVKRFQNTFQLEICIECKEKDPLPTSQSFVASIDARIEIGSLFVFPKCEFH